MEIKKIDAKKRYVLVIDQLVELIENGKFKVGDNLPPERIMASKLGISRPSVREAYSVLEIAGILESKVGSGTYVKSDNIDKLKRTEIKNISDSEESPYEIIEVRKVLEAEIAALAAKNSNKEGVSQLKRILKKMKEELKDNGKYSIETDEQLHLMIADMSNNNMYVKVLQLLLTSMRERLWVMEREKLLQTPGHKESDIASHEQIVEAIEKKDSRSARSSMKKHLTQVQKELRM